MKKLNQPSSTVGISSKPNRKIRTVQRTKPNGSAQPKGCRQGKVEMFWSRFAAFEKSKQELLNSLDQLRKQHLDIQKTKNAISNRRALLKSSLQVCPEIRTDDMKCIESALRVMNTNEESCIKQEQQEDIIQRMKVLEKVDDALYKKCWLIWTQSGMTHETFFSKLAEYIACDACVMEQPLINSSLIHIEPGYNEIDMVDSVSEAIEMCHYCNNAAVNSKNIMSDKEDIYEHGLVVLPCQHRSCFSCFIKFEVSECPMCRKSFENTIDTANACSTLVTSNDWNVNMTSYSPSDLDFHERLVRMGLTHQTSTSQDAPAHMQAN